MKKNSGCMLYISIKVTHSYLLMISRDSSGGEVKLVEDTGMLPLQIRIKHTGLSTTIQVSSDI